MSLLFYMTKPLYNYISILLFAIVIVIAAVSGRTDDRERSFGSADKTVFVKIFTENDAVGRLGRLGLSVDHNEHSEDGTYILAYLNGLEAAQMKSEGVRYEVIYGDWYEEHYTKLPAITHDEMEAQKRLMKETDNVTGFSLGTMGGHLKHNEAIAKIDSMRLQYPSLISAKFSLGTTHQGRPIWAYRITKDPDIPSSKPQVFLNAVTHAREPIGMMNLIYYSYYLLENYNTDVTVKYLLDNRDIYILPFVNPDGYIQNEATNPNGGGMWRKNRRNNGDGTFGIDINRNFGTFQFWNSSNNGSSPATSSDTYRGTSPFSEPETQAIMNLVNSKNFKNSFYYHAFGNYYIYPWAWQDPLETPDSVYFRRFTAEMRTHNNFTPGTSSQTLLYFIRGGCDDWMYNDSGHSKIISILPEVGTGTDGFWPQQNRIVPLVMQQLKPNLFYTGITDTFVQYRGSQFLPAQTFNGGDTARFFVNVRSAGLKNASNITASIASADTFTAILSNDKTFGSFNFFEVKNNQASPFAIRIKNSFIPGQQAKIFVNLKIGVQQVSRDTITITLGTPSGIINNSIPADFALEQNYPNPFNPITNIYYSIPVKMLVRLEVFDVLGNKVMTLVDKRQEAGNYSMQVNAAGIPSGIYYYRLTAVNSEGRNEFSQTKKMILIK